jgi:hypothetical protein
MLILLVDNINGNILSSTWTKAVKQTLFEQEIEDNNSIHRIDNHLVRRLIVMPLTEAFNPNQASAMHGKVQYGDKCSIPGSIGRLIFEKPYEVPWIFEIKPIRKDNSKKVTITSDIDDNIVPPPSQILDKAYISPLDFRSPENYIFLPRWLMKSLDVTTNDVVDVSFVRIKLASLVVLQPLNLAWDKLMTENNDPKTILEHEVNKYSSLTAGSIIAIEYKGEEYSFYVKETQAEGGIAVKGVRVQDSDVKVDIDRSYLDDLIKAIEKKKEEEKEKEMSNTSKKDSKK